MIHQTEQLNVDMKIMHTKDNTVVKGSSPLAALKVAACSEICAYGFVPSSKYIGQSSSAEQEMRDKLLELLQSALKIKVLWMFAPFQDDLGRSSKHGDYYFQCKKACATQLLSQFCDPGGPFI